ncbi:hypothetical protein DFQ28_005680 [Apophysomyces sp. BC1034]|nr:hypothetical protein DFQ30_006297 [Apophysomyces sp. BC1015]KAG0177042.1 hypothetical protein DFQ29_005325 [Apophysomyces sp. BC1021]KAG0187908.1 hypothetical protein DFQ28_005680 [Apophysomyces sp. BC1034]
MQRAIQRAVFASCLGANRRMIRFTTKAQLHPIANISRQRPTWTPSKSFFHTCRTLQHEDENASVDPKHQMLIGFTCKVCEERSHHVMSKLAYTKGVVLIQCPGCENRHLIADNLGWFRDEKTTIEDLVKEKGEAIRKVVVDDKGVEQPGNLMEWLPEISEEERIKKEKAKHEAEKMKKKKREEADQ